MNIAPIIARAFRLRDFRLEGWKEHIEGRWHYRQLAADPQWREGWISFDAVTWNPDDGKVYCGLNSLDGDLLYSFDHAAERFACLGAESWTDTFDVKIHRTILRNPHDGSLWFATSLLHDADRQREAPGGKLVRYDPGTGRFRVVSIPVPHLYVQSIAADWTRGYIYGFTYPAEMLFRTEMATGRTETLAYVGNAILFAQPHNAVVDGQGWLWGTYAETRAWDEIPGPNPVRLFKYHPDGSQFVWFDTGLSRAADVDQLLADHPKPEETESALAQTRHRQDYGFCDSMAWDGERYIYAGTVAGVLCRIDTHTDKVEKVAHVMAAGRFPALALRDGILYGGGGMNGRTQLVRWDTRTDRIDTVNDIREPERGETPARIHEIAVDADHTLWLGENDHHSRSSWLWRVQWGALALLMLLFIAGCANPRAGADPPKRKTRPAWVKQGIVMAGNWEPLTFIRRRGGQLVADVENWNGERTEVAARGLKESGVNLVVTNLHKGFGLRTEAEDIEATRRFTGYAHKYGIRVGGYVGASMMFETFFREEPKARYWMQVDEEGKPIYYNPAQSFRYMGCRNHPGYDDFLRRVMRLGVKDLKLDLIHFDQMESWAEPRSCRCIHCRRLFLQFLDRRYPVGKRLERFGFLRFDDVVPPAMDFPAGPGRTTALVNPLMQEWVRFRSDYYARRYAEYDVFLERMNPEAALEGNPNLNGGMNKAYTHSFDPQLMLRHGDVVWSEEDNHAQWTADGRLVSKIRSFKTTRVMGKSLFVYTGGRYGAQNPESPPHLRLAEAMAYNDMNLGMVGDVAPDGIRLTLEARRYIRFFLEHTKELADTKPVADVAVLRNFASVEFNPSEVLPATVLFEQVLIQNRIPWEPVFDSGLNDLSRYKVLVLANQDALGDDQVAAIRRFVESGGGLVITGNTGLYTDWRLRRAKPALEDLYGRDRVAYIPRIEAVDPPPPAQLQYAFRNEYWKLPKNSAEMVAAVRKAAGGGLSAAVEAPDSVTMELVRQASGGLLLHLVNFRLTQPALNLGAAIRIPAGWRAKEVVAESPDRDGREILPVRVKEDAIEFRIPRLEVYALVSIRLERKS